MITIKDNLYGGCFDGMMSFTAACESCGVERGGMISESVYEHDPGYTVRAACAYFQFAPVYSADGRYRARCLNCVTPAGTSRSARGR